MIVIAVSNCVQNYRFTLKAERELLPFVRGLNLGAQLQKTTVLQI